MDRIHEVVVTASRTRELVLAEAVARPVMSAAEAIRQSDVRRLSETFRPSEPRRSGDAALAAGTTLQTRMVEGKLALRDTLAGVAVRGGAALGKSELRRLRF